MMKQQLHKHCIVLLGLLLLCPLWSISQTQLGQDIDGEDANDRSGTSVSLSADGTVMAVGARSNNVAGHVRIYGYDGDNWNQMGADIDGEVIGDQSGRDVSLSADGARVAIGAFGNDENGNSSGHVRIYGYDGDNWNQLGADIDGEAAGDQSESGTSVSLSADGARVAIGAIGNDGNGNFSGHVRIYGYDGDNWNQVGADIDGEAAVDFSGEDVSLSADGARVAIGASGNDGNGDRSGHVRIYGYDGDNWNQVGADIDGEAAGDVSGISVSLSADGARVAIGAAFNDGNGSNSGHVRIYGYDGDNWNQVGADIDGEAEFDNSGWSVSLSADGARVAIGATGNDGNGNISGHVRIYRYDGDNWNQLGADIDGEAVGDQSGRSVSLSADGARVAIGASDNDGNGTDSGHVRVYSTALLGTAEVAVSSITVFPNPADGMVTISNPNGLNIQTIEVRDVLGRLVLSQNINMTNSTNTVDVSELNNATYMMLIMADGVTTTKQLIKR